MYKIYSKMPINDVTVFISGSLLITDLCVSIMNDNLKTIIARIYWYDLKKVDICDSMHTVINTLYPEDIFNMKFLKSGGLICDIV